MYRRIALRWTREVVAERAGVPTEYVKYFEDGKNIQSDYLKNIKLAIDDGFRELDALNHYKARILELAYEIKFDTDVKQIMQRAAHMTVEVGKLEKYLIDNN
jgi:hypothetical protein